MLITDVVRSPPCWALIVAARRVRRLNRIGSHGASHAALAARPFAVDVQRRNDVAIVQPHGELDLATVETLRAALDGIENAGRLVLDLRGLSFIDSTGLRLLVALHQRAQRDGFQLTLVAPAAPADRAIQLSGLDQALPFVAADDALRRPANPPAPDGRDERMSSTASLPRSGPRDTMPPGSSHAIAAIMIRRHATHSSTRFLPLAYHLARRYHRGADADDLQQVASLGLLKAIDRFDPERGLAFTSFAVPTILGELKRYFRDHGWTVRVPRDLQELKLRVDTISQTLTGELGRSPTAAELAERANATTEQILEALAAATAHHPDSLDQPLTDDGDDAIDFLAADEPGFERVEDAAFVDGLLNTLSDRERVILRLRFEDDLTQAEIGARLGISQMHVSRLIRQAITTLQTTHKPDRRSPVP